MAYYKRSNGSIQMRGTGGRFRKGTLADIGIYNANTTGTVYICNVCEQEFTPLVHSGICCGVDNKRVKEIIVSPEKQVIIDKIKAISGKPFINRKDLEEINRLEWELKRLGK